MTVLCVSAVRGKGNVTVKKWEVGDVEIMFNDGNNKFFTGTASKAVRRICQRSISAIIEFSVSQHCEDGRG